VTRSRGKLGSKSKRPVWTLSDEKRRQKVKRMKIVMSIEREGGLEKKLLRFGPPRVGRKESKGKKKNVRGLDPLCQKGRSRRKNVAWRREGMVFGKKKKDGTT